VKVSVPVSVPPGAVVSGLNCVITSPELEVGISQFGPVPATMLIPITSPGSTTTCVGNVFTTLGVSASGALSATTRYSPGVLVARYTRSCTTSLVSLEASVLHDVISPSPAGTA
jgi:hypothetical protein